MPDVRPPAAALERSAPPTCDRPLLAQTQRHRHRSGMTLLPPDSAEGDGDPERRLWGHEYAFERPKLDVSKAPLADAQRSAPQWVFLPQMRHSRPRRRTAETGRQAAIRQAYWNWLF